MKEKRGNKYRSKSFVEEIYRYVSKNKEAQLPSIGQTDYNPHMTIDGSPRKLLP